MSTEINPANKGANNVSVFRKTEKSDAAFTKTNLNACLSSLAKEFRRLNGTAMPAEIILIGGASVLANYGFRNVTYDVDAVIHASSVMKQVVNRVADKLGLPNGWLNMDFKVTKSYSDRLTEISVYYKTFSNIVTVRTVAAEYLVAMKLMSGRQYKNDLSDIAGILSEHQKRGEPITREEIDGAVEKLYGGWTDIPQSSRDFCQDIFDNGDYKAIYNEVIESEQSAKKALLDFEEQYPKTLNEENINTVIEQAKRRKEASSSDTPRSGE